MRRETFRAFVIYLIGVLSVVLTACSSTPKESPPPQTTSTSTSTQQAQPSQRYDLTGKVVAVDKSRKTLTVDHEAIPGFMGAMTMAYPVKDEQQLDRLSPGDQITAKVVSTTGGFWLEDIFRAAPKTPTP